MQSACGTGFGGKFCHSRCFASPSTTQPLPQTIRIVTASEKQIRRPTLRFRRTAEVSRSNSASDAGCSIFSKMLNRKDIRRLRDYAT